MCFTKRYMYQHQRLTEMMLKGKAESMHCCSVTTCPGLQNACWHTGTKHRHRLLLLELTCRFLGCNLALKHASKPCLREGRPGFPSALLGISSSTLRHQATWFPVLNTWRRWANLAPVLCQGLLSGPGAAFCPRGRPWGHAATQPHGARMEENCRAASPQNLAS